jgi:hypothetical protein
MQTYFETVFYNFIVILRENIYFYVKKWKHITYLYNLLQSLSLLQFLEPSKCLSDLQQFYSHTVFSLEVLGLL